VGVDTDPNSLDVARRRFEGRTGFDFMTPALLEEVGAGGPDLLICTETLEHVDDSAEAIANLARWGKPGARLIISVPIEVGPSLIVKQVGRYLATAAGPYGYEPYEWSELVSAGLLWDADAFDSSHRHPTPVGGKGHKGFDFRRIRREVERFFQVDKALFTPFPFLGTAFNSTAFYVATLNRSS
jgi:SAM-dependent methyltransferase